VELPDMVLAVALGVALVDILAMVGMVMLRELPGVVVVAVVVVAGI